MARRRPKDTWPERLHAAIYGGICKLKRRLLSLSKPSFKIDHIVGKAHGRLRSGLSVSRVILKCVVCLPALNVEPSETVDLRSWPRRIRTTLAHELVSSKRVRKLNQLMFIARTSLCLDLLEVLSLPFHQEVRR